MIRPITNRARRSRRGALLLVALALVLAGAGRAGAAGAASPPLFQPQAIYPTGAFPVAVAVRDLNGDGFLDLTTANNASDTVSVLLGNGDGTFQAERDYSVGPAPAGLIAGDLDGDGRLDLAVANQGCDSVSVLLGNGDGTFRAPGDYATGAFPAAVAAGDLNGDGRLDLATADAGSDTVSVLLGNGDGTFQVSTPYATGQYPQAIVAGDLNGDGRLDLAVTNQDDDTIGVLLGNGDGTFQVSAPYPTGAAPYGLVAADLDGDGRLDLATANIVGDTVSVLLGNGDGSFRAAMDYPVGPAPAGLVAGDLDGDGRPDLVTTGFLDDSVSVLLGNGDGTFQGEVRYGAGTNPLGLAAGDFDRDGALDLVTANASGNSVSVLLHAAPRPVVTGVAPTSGSSAGGTLVTITGTSFGGATAVAFGGVAATGFTVDSATTITATAPAHAAGAVDVTVTTPAGTSATSADDRFTYVAPPTPPAASGLQYYPLVSPIRLLDTRRDQPACDAPGARLAGGTTRTERARTACAGIPAEAQAIVGNATAANPADGGAGFITLYPSGAGQPPTSTLNYAPGQTVANAFTVGLGSDGAFGVYASTTLDAIVDVTGYYAPPGPSGLYFHALPAPKRLLDTRSGFGACATSGARLASAAPRTVALRGCGGIPAAAQAVVGTATVVNAVGGGAGFVTLYPSGAGQPPTSNLNYVPGQVVPNAFTVGIGGDGAIAIFSSSPIDFVLDVTGYYSAEPSDANGPGLSYVSLPSPVRLLDTRAGQPACDQAAGLLGGNASRTEPARNGCTGIPAEARAIVGNATVVNPASGGAGFVTLYPSGAAQPNASNLNYLPGQVAANAFIVGLGGDGAFAIYAYTPVHFVVDLVGYFAP